MRHTAVFLQLPMFVQQCKHSCVICLVLLFYLHFIFLKNSVLMKTSFSYQKTEPAVYLRKRDTAVLRKLLPNLPLGDNITHEIFKLSKNTYWLVKATISSTTLLLKLGVLRLLNESIPPSSPILDIGRKYLEKRPSLYSIIETGRLKSWWCLQQ